jgi:glycosyltransferase involved in cell wall biosynthesis
MQAVARMHVELLAQLGWDVTVIRGRRPEESTVSRPVPGLEELTIPWPPRGLLPGRLPGHFARDLKRFSRDAGCRALRLAPDVIYAEGLVAWDLLRQPGLQRPPVLFHPHGLETHQQLGRRLEELRSHPLRRLASFHARRADGVISQGGGLTRLLLERCGTPASRIHLLPNGIDAGQLAPEARSAPRRPLRLLFLGRNVYLKGLDHLLEALGRVPDLTLDVVGAHAPVGLPGDPGERIRWHGVVRSRDRIRQLYDAADLFLLPSLAEGFPTVLLEAMGRGLPVIASEVGAVPEVFAHGAVGWLVRPGRVEPLIDALQEAKALSDAEYATLSATALRTVGAHFTTAQVGEALARILEEVATRR